MQTVTLIIDKRRELSTKYKKLLGSKNNSVIITKNLLSAIKFIQDKEPDLILILTALTVICQTIAKNKGINLQYAPNNYCIIKICRT